MALSSRRLRNVVACILLLCAGYHLIIILAQTDSISGGVITEYLQSGYGEMYHKIKLNNRTVEDIAVMSVKSAEDEISLKYSGPLVRDNRDNSLNMQFAKARKEVVQSEPVIDGPRASNSGSLGDKKMVRTPDIPYESFLPPKGVWRVNHNKVIDELPEEYENIAFLKNKPSDDDMLDAIPEQTELNGIKQNLSERALTLSS